MRLPVLNEIPTTMDMIDVFKGYNHNLRIGDGEFYDMKNLTSSKYPVLAPRDLRGLYIEGENTFPVNPQGLIQKDTLCYVDGTDFVINAEHVKMNLSTKEEDCPKQLVSMGVYVIIMPDKKWVNTSNKNFGNIEAYVTTTATVSFEMCRVDGSAYEDVKVSEVAPDNPKNMDYWIDTSSTPHTLNQWNETTGTWVSIATTYIKISSESEEIGKEFNIYDAVTISGIEEKQISDLNGTMTIWDKGDNYIVVTGVLASVTQQNNPITIERIMPNMDFVIESENRLWGCRYGVAKNGEVVNEIYASKLGDFKNWNVFNNLSTDSYVASVGTDGEFTGAIAHLGHPIFFKENYMHKIYGNFPANYQITTTACRGVQKGSHKSLAIVNEILYYKSNGAVCAYDGSLPQEVSYALGKVVYSNAVASAYRDKYYISMHDDTLGKDDLTDINQWHLFVYDTSLGLWHKEDNTRVVDFCPCRDELYFINHSDNQIKTMFGSGDRETARIKWMAETGIIGTNDLNKKYISKINIRMSLELNTNVFFYIQYDSNENWEFLFRMEGSTLRSFSIPIRPKRCDHLKLRIEGEGEAKIYSISKTYEKGSDI